MKVMREDQVKIGGVYVAAAAGSLTLRSSDPDASTVQLDPEGVTELLSFLRSIVISPNDRRRAYRVQIPTACGFRATLFVEAGSISCEARDLSLSGVRLQPALPDAAGIEIGTVARVLLEFDSESVIVDATILRRAGSEFGLAFLDRREADEVDSLPGLARIMRLLERFWAAETWMA